MTSWYWLMELIMRYSRCNNMRGTLNSVELIRVEPDSSDPADRHTGYRNRCPNFQISDILETSA